MAAKRQITNDSEAITWKVRCRQLPITINAQHRTARTNRQVTILKNKLQKGDRTKNSALGVGFGVSSTCSDCSTSTFSYLRLQAKSAAMKARPTAVMPQPIGVSSSAPTAVPPTPGLSRTYNELYHGSEPGNTGRSSCRGSPINQS